MIYSEKALSNFLEFRNTGSIKGADATAKIVNKECGDIFKIFTKIENGIISEAKFQAFGSVLVFASLSAAVDIILGKTPVEIQNISLQDLLRKLDQFPKSKIYILKNTIDVIQKLSEILISADSKIKKYTFEDDLNKKDDETYENSEVVDLVKNNEKSSKNEKNKKLTAEDVCEIFESMPTVKTKPLSRKEIKTEILVTTSRKKNKKPEDVLEHSATSEDFGSVDEIDSITARLSEALSRLKTK